MEADFLRFYGLDLRHEATRMSARRMVSLIRALPSDSAVGRLHARESRSESKHENKTVITSGAAFAGWMNNKAGKV